MRSLPLLVALAAVAVVLVRHQLSPRALKSHAPAPYIGLSNVWTAEQLDNLVKMVEGYGHLPSATADQTAATDNVGETMEMLANGQCTHPYMIPNRNRTGCVFASRLDVGRHYIVSGGRSGLKEPYERLVGRMLSFNKFLFAHEDTLRSVPEFSALFHSKAYLDATASICELGVAAPITDPFQVGIIIQIPGQVVPMHYDAPYFYSGGRFDIPIWLLVAMQFSGLWEAERVHQVQGVAYVHQWPRDKVNGGAFFHYPQGPGGPVQVFEAERNRAILLDGSKLVHGTDPFRPEERDILLLDRTATNRLVFKGNSTWNVEVNGDVAGVYATSDLRISLVWRSLCFRTEEERKAYHSGAFGSKLTVESVLATFRADLIARGKLSATGTPPSRLELSLLILDTYIEYPMAAGWMPVNYCAAARLVGEEWRSLANKVLSLVC